MWRFTAAAIAVLVVEVAVIGGRWKTSIAHAARPAADAGVGPDLFARSRGFRDMLAAMHVRGEELDRRERDLAAREAALRILERIGAEEAMRAEPAGATVRGDVANGGPALAKIYQGMRPEDAAPIIDRLDDATARAILAGMRERQVGAILAAMSRERAVVLTKLLAESRGPS